MKKTLSRMLIGFVGGGVIGNLMVLLTSDESGVFCSRLLLQKVGSLSGALALQTFLSALIGAVGMGGMSLYDFTEFSLVSATLIHIGMIETVFLPVAMFLGWISPSLTDILVMSACMLIAFVLIWLAMFFYYRHEARQLNRINPNHRN